MPSLQILKGPNEGAVIPLNGDRFVMGRNPDCQIVIPITSVSREHAQILRIGGKFYIEDKQSRNGTFVNNQAISGRTMLKNNDRVRICDFVCAFVEEMSTDQSEDLEGEPGEDGATTVEASLHHSSNNLLTTQPAEKLRLLLDISNNLSRTLELNSLLPKIADSLFQLFRQADRCFLIQVEGDKLLPRLVRTRRPGMESEARFSRSIVRQTIKTATAFSADDASRDERVQLSQSVVDFRIRSVMCAPLCKADGTAFGVIQLDTQDRAKKFTQDDLKLLVGVANQAAISLENARLLDEAVKQERVQRDLALAKRVHESFLPKLVPSLPGYEFWGFSESAREVGGDYYGYIPLRNGQLVVAVGDVAGKGVPASLLMAKLSSDIRYSMLTETDAGAAVTRLNDLLHEFTSQMDRFITLSAAVIDPVSHKITLVNAGHSSPLLVKPKVGEVLEATPSKFGGLPLGMVEGYPYDTLQIEIQPGESLVQFTDGADESMNVKGEKFGMERIVEILKAAGNVSAKELGEKLVSTIKAYAAGRDPHDDLTVVVLKRC